MPVDGGGCGTRLKFKTGGNYRAKLSRCGCAEESGDAEERSREEPEKKEATLLQNQVLKLS